MGTQLYISEDGHSVWLIKACQWNAIPVGHRPRRGDMAAPPLIAIKDRQRREDPRCQAQKDPRRRSAWETLDDSFPLQNLHESFKGHGNVTCMESLFLNHWHP